MSAWNDFVKKIYWEGKKSNPNYEFKNALRSNESSNYRYSGIGKVKPYRYGDTNVIINTNVNHNLYTIFVNRNRKDIEDKYDGYFVEIKIKKVGVNRKFPLLSYVDENGVRMFSNDMVGKTVYIDKIALEDAIEYQKIEFDIIKGYYFNDGFNYKIAETIKYLFNKRVEMKKAKNPIQMVYKELMNSAYGKTILKNTNTDYKYFSSIRDPIEIINK